MRSLLRCLLETMTGYRLVWMKSCYWVCEQPSDLSQRLHQQITITSWTIQFPRRKDIREDPCNRLLLRLSQPHITQDISPSAHVLSHLQRRMNSMIAPLLSFILWCSHRKHQHVVSQQSDDGQWKKKPWLWDLGLLLLQYMTVAFFAYWC